MAGYFEDEDSVLINQTVRPALGPVRLASMELSDIHMVLIEVTKVNLHSFYTLV